MMSKTLPFHNHISEFNFHIMVMGFQGNHILCITSCMKHIFTFPRKQLKIMFISPATAAVEML